MKNKSYQVHCKTNNQFNALVNFYKEKGYTGPIQKDQVAQYPWVIIFPVEKHIGGNSNNWAYHTTLSFEEAFDLQFKPVKVTLNDKYTAEIQQDGSVMVGCQSFTPAAIMELHIKLVEVLANEKKN